LKRGQVFLAIVLMAFGMMMALQVRSTRDLQLNQPQARAQELTSRLKDIKEERDTLLGQVSDLRKEMDRVSTGKGTVGQAIQGQLEAARLEAGLTAVGGAGVQVTLDDSPKELQPGEDPNLYILHEEDLLKVVNELKAGGAEAISVNDQRILAMSEIRCAGNTILINTRKIAPPIVIIATGNPDTLKSGLEIKGGIFEQLKFWGLGASVEKKDAVKIPAYSGPVTFKYTKPVKEGE
jgi:uncharacterized protein YlxW (UPF0749 family)